MRAGDGGARQYRYEKLRELVSATAGNEADADAADEQLSVALEAGKAAVEIGWIDPEYAKAALTELLLSEAASTRTRHRFASARHKLKNNDPSLIEPVGVAA